MIKLKVDGKIIKCEDFEILAPEDPLVRIHQCQPDATNGKLNLDNYIGHRPVWKITVPIISEEYMNSVYPIYNKDIYVCHWAEQDCISKTLREMYIPLTKAKDDTINPLSYTTNCNFYAVLPGKNKLLKFYNENKILKNISDLNPERFYI